MESTGRIIASLGAAAKQLRADMGTESIEAVIKPKIRAYREVVGIPSPKAA
jgi:hypothetical protein